MIRATIVLLVAWLVIPRLRRRSAAERHLIWAAALMMAAVLPAWTALMPAWAPDWARHVVDAWPSVTRGPWAVSPDVVVRATSVDAGAWTVERVALAVWILGMAIAVLSLARDVARLAPLVRHAAPSNDDVRAVALEVATRLGLARVPAVVVSARALTPMTWGVRRAQVLLPLKATEWPRERLTAVLAHEFAHVVRGDWVVHVVAQIVCAIYWFHPLFWVAERTLGRESEQAADDQALRAGVDARDYASHLVAIVRDARAASSIRTAAVAMARAAYLERRIAALLRTGANRDRVTRRAVVRAAVASGVLAMPIGAMSVDRTFDVDVRAASLPSALATTSDSGWEPMLPFVRRARTMDAVTGSGGDRTTAPAIAEYTTPPLYSDEARRRGIEGIVTIGVHVDEHGALSAARVMNGLGAGLDQNALVAMRQWRFRPGMRAGVPVPSDAEVEIEFNLRSEAINELIANDMATLVGPDVTPPRVMQTSPLPLHAGRASGSVVLDVVLLQNGSPKIVRILRSLSPQADEIAVRHFEQWRFTPAMKRGVPVKVRMNAEVRFHG